MNPLRALRTLAAGLVTPKALRRVDNVPPWMVSLRDDDGIVVCGGAIVAVESRCFIVATAAHCRESFSQVCVDGLKGSDGRPCLYPKSAATYGVWDDPMQGDWAFLRIARPPSDPCPMRDALELDVRIPAEMSSVDMYFWRKQNSDCLFPQATSKAALFVLSARVWPEKEWQRADNEYVRKKGRRVGGHSYGAGVWPPAPKSYVTCDGESGGPVVSGGKLRGNISAQTLTSVAGIALEPGAWTVTQHCVLRKDASACAKASQQYPHVNKGPVIL